MNYYDTDQSSDDCDVDLDYQQIKCVDNFNSRDLVTYAPNENIIQQIMEQCNQNCVFNSELNREIEYSNRNNRDCSELTFWNFIDCDCIYYIARNEHDDLRFIISFVDPSLNKRFYIAAQFSDNSENVCVWISEKRSRVDQFVIYLEN